MEYNFKHDKVNTIKISIKNLYIYKITTTSENSKLVVNDNNKKFRSFRSKENIHKKEVGPYRGYESIHEK